PVAVLKSNDDVRRGHRLDHTWLATAADSRADGAHPVARVESLLGHQAYLQVHPQRVGVGVDVGQRRGTLTALPPADGLGRDLRGRGHVSLPEPLAQPDVGRRQNNRVHPRVVRHAASCALSASPSTAETDATGSSSVSPNHTRFFMPNRRRRINTSYSRMPRDAFWLSTICPVCWW